MLLSIVSTRHSILFSDLRCIREKKKSSWLSLQVFGFREGAIGFRVFGSSGLLCILVLGKGAHGIDGGHGWDYGGFGFFLVVCVSFFVCGRVGWVARMSVWSIMLLIVVSPGAVPSSVPLISTLFSSQKN